MEWEQIDNFHQRAKVHGGWLVKAYECVVHFTVQQGLVDNYDFRVSMTFVPDVSHMWKIEEKQNA